LNNYYFIIYSLRFAYSRVYPYQFDELSPDLAELKKAFAHPVTGVRTKTLTRKLTRKTYHHCFVGSPSRHFSFFLSFFPSSPTSLLSRFYRNLIANDRCWFCLWYCCYYRFLLLLLL